MQSVEQLQELFEFANEGQKLKLQALIDNDCSWTKAGEALGLNEATIRGSVRALTIRAGRTMNPVQALSPTETPIGFSVDRISKHVGKDGTTSGWVIANREKENQMELWKEVIEGLSVSLERVQPIEPPTAYNEDLLCDYTIGDAHIGMKSWALDADTDWTLAKGVEILRRGVNHLVSTAPNAETAYILDVGDFIHSDNQSNKTSHSGNQLDVDGRWAEVVQAAIHCVYDLIDMCLSKHKKVIFRSVIGNHNEHTAITLNMLIKMRYTNEPRVEVQDSAQLHNYYQFGVNLLADTHGHTTKMDKLPLLMATDEPQMWAATTNRVWRCGHLHHEITKEYPGAMVKVLRTLTPKDAWHRASGYRSNREMEMTTYHKHTGRVDSRYVNPTMLYY